MKIANVRVGIVRQYLEVTTSRKVRSIAATRTVLVPIMQPQRGRVKKNPSRNNGGDGKINFDSLVEETVRVAPIKFEFLKLLTNVTAVKRDAMVKGKDPFDALVGPAVNGTDIICDPVRPGLDPDRRNGEECCKGFSGEQHRRRRRAKIKMRGG